MDKTEELTQPVFEWEDDRTVHSDEFEPEYHIPDAVSATCPNASAIDADVEGQMTQKRTTQEENSEGNGEESDTDQEYEFE